MGALDGFFLVALRFRFLDKYNLCMRALEEELVFTMPALGTLAEAGGGGRGGMGYNVLTEHTAWSSWGDSSSDSGKD